MRRRLLVWAVPGAALWLGGCAFVHKASEAEDAQAKAFTTRPGKGALYIYRSELLVRRWGSRWWSTASAWATPVASLSSAST